MAAPSRVYLKDISSKPKALKNQEISKGKLRDQLPPFFAPRESGEWIKRWMCVPAFANKIIKSGNSKSGCCYDIPLDVQETISFKQHDCRLNANVCRRSGYTRYVLDPLHFCLSISYSTVVLHFRFLPSLFLSHYTNTESDVTRSPYLLKKFRFS